MSILTLLLPDIPPASHHGQLGFLLPHFHTPSLEPRVYQVSRAYTPDYLPGPRPTRYLSRPCVMFLRYSLFPILTYPGLVFLYLTSTASSSPLHKALGFSPVIQHIGSDCIVSTLYQDASKFVITVNVNEAPSRSIHTHHV